MDARLHCLRASRKWKRVEQSKIIFLNFRLKVLRCSRQFHGCVYVSFLGAGAQVREARCRVGSGLVFDSLWWPCVCFAHSRDQAAHYKPCAWVSDA